MLEFKLNILIVCLSEIECKKGNTGYFFDCVKKKTLVLVCI